MSKLLMDKKNAVKLYPTTGTAIGNVGTDKLIDGMKKGTPGVGYKIKNK